MLRNVMQILWSYLRQIPSPVWMSIFITALGILTSALWGPGYTAFSMDTAVISCVIGGLSIWLWIIQTTYFEWQTIRPYTPRPACTRDSKGNVIVSDEKILKWFTDTMLKNRDAKVLGVLAVYLVILIAGLTFINLKISKGIVVVINILMLIFYAYFAIILPIFYMVGENESSKERIN